MDNPCIEFVKKIDLNKSRIKNYTGFVLFCGGEFDPISIKPLSARDAVLRYICDNNLDKSYRIIQAEDIQEWINYGIYKNLIDFEEDLADLASLVVLFVESPGSIAELGAFCVINKISKKLIVFVRDYYCKYDSYIKLGPIKYLEEKNKESIRIYPWDQITEECIIEKDVVSGITEDIEKYLNKLPKTNKFDSINHGHIMILLTDLIDIALAAKFNEIRNWLDLLGLDNDYSLLQKYLFTLVKLELIKEVNHGDVYYIINEQKEYLEFNLTNNKPFDRMRIKAEMSRYYKEHDNRRLYVISYDRERRQI